MRFAVAQSGGPTAAINASLAGICSAASEISKELEKKGEPPVTVFGVLHGVQGLMEGKLVDMAPYSTDPPKMELLKKTPAAALGSCRFRLPDPDTDDTLCRRLQAVLEEHQIDVLFYIGGNDSMDTAAKLSRFLTAQGSPIRIIGVPKTIDNDLAGTDHTPGFGSAAKYLAMTISEIIRDCSVYQVQSVTICEIMGRDAGWLAASTCVLRRNGEDAPHLIYLPESEFTVEQFLRDVRQQLEKRRSVICAVSEGVCPPDAEGFRSGASDSFGHAYLSGIGKYLENCIRREIGCKVRSVELNVMQRCSAHAASYTDLIEAERCGIHAAWLGYSGATGIMVTMNRRKSSSYEISYGSIPASEAANAIRRFPKEWITPEGNQVCDEAIGYFLPLIQGEVYPAMQNGMPMHICIPGVSDL